MKESRSFRAANHAKNQPGQPPAQRSRLPQLGLLQGFALRKMLTGRRSQLAQQTKPTYFVLLDNSLLALVFLEFSIELIASSTLGKGRPNRSQRIRYTVERSNPSFRAIAVFLFRQSQSRITLACLAFGILCMAPYCNISHTIIYSD